MSENIFTINGTDIKWTQHDFPFTVASFPSPYDVDIIETNNEYDRLIASADFIIIDRNILRLYPLTQKFSGHAYEVEAIESNKNIATVTNIIDALVTSKISKGSKVLAVGGGIIQDLAACACALFRRGQPFTYLPTTTLGQLDSCVGGKCAINTSTAKNILGLFSAPASVKIPTFMLKTISTLDHRAGLSEMLRLCLTASSKALADYIELFPSIAFPGNLDSASYGTALSLSLSIKKSVVDYDEYEKDIRRSMNYGHTFGHAIEKLVHFRIPHGLAVLIGIHMANTYALDVGIMQADAYTQASYAVQLTLSRANLDLDLLSDLDASTIVEQFRYDKKGDGTSVPLILLRAPGDMCFERFYFSSSTTNLQASLEKSICDLQEWSKQ